MKKYKYQLHAHTMPCSACASMTPEELIEGLYDGGYRGCVITNHFLCGNTGIDRGLSWNEFVRRYESDYLACCEHAKKYDIDILFGIEENVSNGLEILCYGITPEILYKHHELSDGNCKTWYQVVHSYGGLCIQAHPFRERDYILKAGMLPLEYIDGVEIYNYFNNDKNNREAEEFAEKHPELLLVSGADAHLPKDVCKAGIEVNERICDGKKLINILRTGNYRLLKD